MATQTSTITLELEGIMILSFAQDLSKCAIIIPKTDDLHTFLLGDGVNIYPIIGNGSLSVVGGAVTQTAEFRDYSVDMKHEHGSDLRYRSDFRPMNKLEVFDGTFGMDKERLRKADLRYGSINPSPRVIADSKLVTFTLSDGQELVFRDGSGEKRWNGNTKIKISNLCDPRNPRCRDNNDFEYYYGAFDVSAPDKLNPRRLKPPLVATGGLFWLLGNSRGGRQDLAAARSEHSAGSPTSIPQERLSFNLKRGWTRRAFSAALLGASAVPFFTPLDLPCWDVYLHEECAN